MLTSLPYATKTRTTKYIHNKYFYLCSTCYNKTANRQTFIAALFMQKIGLFNSWLSVQCSKSQGFSDRQTIVFSTKPTNFSLILKYFRLFSVNV